MPTLEPIVVNAPKEKKTYTYSENDIVDIVAQAIKQGKIEAGAGFEEVEIKLYYSDLSFSGSECSISNQTKVTEIANILDKVDNGKLVIASFDTGELSSDNSYRVSAAGAVSSLCDKIDIPHAYGFGLNFSDSNFNTMVTIISNTYNIKQATSLTVGVDSNNFSVHIQEMAQDSSKYISLKFRVEK